MKSFKALLIFMVALLSATAALACPCGLQNDVNITNLEAGQAYGIGVKNFFIYFGQNNSTPATCAGTNISYFIVDPTTDYGKASMAIATLAYAGGLKVKAQGAGTCTLGGTVEDLGFIYTE